MVGLLVCLKRAIEYGQRVESNCQTADPVTVLELGLRRLRGKVLLLPRRPVTVSAVGWVPH